MTLKSLGLCSTLLLVGCASTPRPELPDAGYAVAAQEIVGGTKCGTLGYTSPESASLGVAYIKSDLNAYRYDLSRMTTQLQVTEQNFPTVSREACNKFAMWVSERTRQIDTHNQNAQDQQESLQNMINNRPRQTYCNRVAGQTLCNTY